MPILDLSEAFEAIEFADRFTVIRRTETISQFGRSERTPIRFPSIIGTLYPSGDNSLVRADDQTRGGKTLTVVSRFRLQQASPGYQPDLIIWGGDFFVVKDVRDFSRFGAGMIVAECSSIDSIDLPPGTLDLISKPAPLRPPREQSFWNDDGVLAFFMASTAGWPTSPVGLTPGSVWTNGLTVAVVPGVIPDPSARPLFFGSISAKALLNTGGGDLPLTLPATINQLWNNGGNVSIVLFVETIASLWNDGGALAITPGAEAIFPTSPLGLNPGDVWNNGFTIAVVPGFNPRTAAPLYFGSITAAQLLATGGSTLPVALPATKGQLWNNGGQISVA